MAKHRKSAPIDEPDHGQLATIREPTHAEMEVRAYYRYLERGLQDGFDLDDWLAAEVDLRAIGGALTADA